MVKTQVPTAPGGRFANDQFRIDLQTQTMTCPARVTVAIRPARRGGGRARFGAACSICPLRQACTTSLRAGSSPSTPKKPSWPPLAPVSVIPPGWRTTEQPGPR